MKRPKATVLVMCFFIAITFWVCINPSTESKLMSTTNDLPPALKEIIDKQEYKNWKILSGSGKDTLKRLGLPVHGRWVRTYINEVADSFYQQVLTSKNEQGPFIFPKGSCIIKENYRSSNTFEGISPDSSLLQVLTTLYKPHEDFCATSHLADFNGKNCYGGEWFYGFTFVEPNGTAKAPALKLKLQKKVTQNIGSFCVNCHAAGYKTDYIRTLAKDKFPFAQPSEKSYCAQFDGAISSSPSDETIPESVKNCVQKWDAFCENISLDSIIPPDVPCNPEDIVKYYGSDKAQQMFDCFGWRTFIALNFPNVAYDNKNPKRGVPQKTFNSADSKMQPRVWETFKTAYEVFQPGNVKWNPVNQKWNEPRPNPVDKKGMACALETGEIVLTMASKSKDIPNETGQAFAGTFGYLVDRNKKDVRYEVLFNRTEFEYIISDNKAATVNLTPGGPAKNGKLLPVTFPDNRTDTTFNQGAIEIKSAWKELCIGDTCAYADAPTLAAAKEKFYIRNLLIYNEVDGSCRRADMALIGLHVTHKTYFAPQWIWMTFEHKDNVPETTKTDKNYTFFNPENAKKLDTINCFQFPFLWPKQEVTYCPNVDINRFLFRDAPNQMTRLAPLDKIVIDLNEKFQSLLDSVDSPFKNYILVNVQWPVHARRDADGIVNTINCANNKKGDTCFVMKPRFLRNSVIESFMSNYCTKGKITNFKQYSNRSCMGCHGQVGSDFSYIWLDGVSQRVPIKRD